MQILNVPYRTAILGDDTKRDSFISGISSTFIRERLLENQILLFNQACEKARTLNPLSTKKISCKLYHWGPMDPRFQKSIWLQRSHTNQQINIKNCSK